MSLLGLCLVGSGETREAGFQHLRAAIEAEPAEPRWHLHLGRGLRQQGRFDESEASYAAAAKLSNDAPGILMQWGKALRLCARPDDAAQVYARIIAKKPSRTAWLAACDALSEAGDPVTAAIAYGKAYPESGRPDFAIAALADRHIALQQYAQARRLNADLLKKTPDDPDAQLRAVQIQVLMGEGDAPTDRLLELWDKHSGHAGIAADVLKAGNDAAFETASAIARDTSANQDERRNCAFALCAYSDMSGQVDAAWDWAVLANSLYPETSLSVAPLRERLDVAIADYQRTKAQDADTARTKMIYLLGAPLSGGDYLQTVLSSHGSLRSAGRHGRLIKSLSTLPGDSAALSETLSGLAKKDMAATTRSYGMASGFVDNTPSNILIAGLLEKVHAGAVFIAPHRPASDMAVALFFSDLGADFPYARSLAAIQDYLDFHEAAQLRWREAGLKIIPHNHEKFLSAKTQHSAALFQALGLEGMGDISGAGQGNSAHAYSGQAYESHLAAAGFRGD